MKIILEDISYEEFQQFFLTKQESEKEVQRLYMEYHNNKNPIMMNNHESKEYADKLRAARNRTYTFNGLVLKDVFVGSFKVGHDCHFQSKDGHIVPVTVNLEINYTT